MQKSLFPSHAPASPEPKGGLSPCSENRDTEKLRKRGQDSGDVRAMLILEKYTNNLMTILDRRLNYTSISWSKQRVVVDFYNFGRKYISMSKERMYSISF